MKTGVLISDGHVSPFEDLSRFLYAGRLIADLQPNFIGNIGDLATNDSVTFWDVPHADKVTLLQDVCAVKEAQRLLFAPMKAMNKRRKKSKHKMYKPHTFMTMGNHEDRLSRRIALNETGLGSVIDPISLYDFDKYWDDIVDYKEYYEYEGVLYTHCPTTRLGKPMTGVHRGRQIAMQSSMPVIYGHTHTYDYTSVGLIGNENKARSALNMPCFMDQNHVEKYAKGSTTGWDYGLVIIKMHKPGEFTYEWISTEELKARYS